MQVGGSQLVGSFTSWIFFFVCRRCSGRGTFTKNPCGECRGVGQTNKRQKVRILFQLFVLIFLVLR